MCRGTVGPKHFGDILGPSSLLPAELLLQCFEECFVRGFQLSICRWVNRSGIIISNPKFGAPCAKRSAIKLLSVVNNKGIWDAESTYDRALKKFYHVVGGDGGECLGFGPLGEIVYCNKKEFPPPGGMGPTMSTPHFANGQGEVIRLSFSGGFFISRANL
jgi:hypothetical protein